MLTHHNLLAMTLNDVADVDRAAPGEHLIHAAPMSHGSGLYAIPNVAAGSTPLVPASRGFGVAELDALLEHAPRAKFFAAPTMVMRLVDGLRGDARHLKQIVYSGGPMYVADCRRALAHLGTRLVQIYGQGESPMTITVLPAADHLRAADEDESAWLASRLGGPRADRGGGGGARRAGSAAARRRDGRSLRARRHRDARLPGQRGGHRGHARWRLAAYRRPGPRRYVFGDELPKNAARKVLKRELRARLLAGDPN